MAANIPKPNNVYLGFISNINYRGYQIRLSEFGQKFEGSLKAHLIEPKSKTMMTKGRYVKVKVMSVSDRHVEIDLVNIEKGVRKMMRGKRNKKTFLSQSQVESSYNVHKQPKKGYKVEVIVKNELPIYYETAKLNQAIGSTLTVCSDKILQTLFMESRILPSQLQLHNFYDEFELVRMSDSMWIDGGKFENELLVTQQYFSKKMGLKNQRKSLPIYSVRSDLMKFIKNNQFLIVQGETGSGKSTQIPQYLLEAGYGRSGIIACTQPRKCATVTLAQRGAKENKCKLGTTVGYKYRFCNKTTRKTLIKYLTEGTLEREFLNKELLKLYSAIILDEAHERTANMDILLGYLKEKAKTRPNLKVIIASATMEAKKFSTFLNNAPIFTIKGCTHPVEIFHYDHDPEDYLKAAVSTVVYIMEKEDTGDILVFLTGQEEIEMACDVLSSDNELYPDLIVYPFYGALHPQEQLKIFKPTPTGKRKVVFATNIAETSVTIPGIKFVVDSGYAKMDLYNANSGMEFLKLIKISQASAVQRAGRAGRTEPGKCYRVYTKKFYEEMPKAVIPEITRSNLASIVLPLKAVGINDIEKFQFVDPPQKETILMAEKHLYWHNALNEKGGISELGKQMVQFPIEPNLSKMLIESVKFECSDEIATIVAMLNVQNLFIFRRKKDANMVRQNSGSSESDLIKYLNIFKTWETYKRSSCWCYENCISDLAMSEALKIRTSLLEKMKANKMDVISCNFDLEKVQKAICAGLIQNVAKFEKGKCVDTPAAYKTLHRSQIVYIHPSTEIDTSKAQWLVYQRAFESNIKYIQNITVINPEWLGIFAPNIYEVKKAR